MYNCKSIFGEYGPKPLMRLCRRILCAEGRKAKFGRRRRAGNKADIRQPRKTGWSRKTDWSRWPTDGSPTAEDDRQWLMMIDGREMERERLWLFNCVDGSLLREITASADHCVSRSLCRHDNYKLCLHNNYKLSAYQLYTAVRNCASLNCSRRWGDSSRLLLAID